MSKKRLHQWWLNNEYHDNYNIKYIIIYIYIISILTKKVVSSYLYVALINFIPFYYFEANNLAFRK